MNETYAEWAEAAAAVMRKLPDNLKVIGLNTHWIGYNDGMVVQVWSEDGELADWADKAGMRWWIETDRLDNDDVVWVIDENGTAIIELVTKK